VTGINFKTPLMTFLGIILLSIFSYPNYKEALGGFINEPLFYTSGLFVCLLSLIMLAMQAKERKASTILGGLLGFSYGVFISIITGLMIQSLTFDKAAFGMITFSTALVLLVDSTLENKFKFIDDWFESTVNTNGRIIAYYLSLTAIFILILLFVLFKLGII
jgi:hypothetical protein